MTQCNTYAVLARYGHTGSSLAEALGVNQATVSRWAVRGVPLDQLARVCAVLGCRPDELRPECVEVDGDWCVSVDALRAEVARLGRPNGSRIARWCKVVELMDGFGEPALHVQIDRLAG